MAVLEARRVGGGTTGRSTGNLYAAVDRHLASLASKYDAAVVRQVVGLRTDAIDQIEDRVRRHAIACAFERVPFWLVAEALDDVDVTSDEVAVARAAGLDASWLPGAQVPLAFPVRAAARVAAQAQLDPQRYTRGLAAVVAAAGGHVHELSAVVELDDDASGRIAARTATGHRVVASHAVMATHTPKGQTLHHTLLGPYREHAVALRLRDPACAPPPGVFWVLAHEHHHSLRRVVGDDGAPALLALGAPYKVGQGADTRARVAALVAWVAARFDVAEVTHAWGAQAYRPADGLPAIGPISSGSPVLVATGFAADGLVWGTVAADILAERIAGREHAGYDLLRSTRHRPLKAAAAFVRENANVALQYLKDLLGRAEVAELADVARGEGRIVPLEGHRYGAYRDPRGDLHVVSPFCTHMGCIVRFNAAETSWDCPCHGSRFDVDGRVIEGPAWSDLPRLGQEPEP